MAESGGRGACSSLALCTPRPPWEGPCPSAPNLSFRRLPSRSSSSLLLGKKVGELPDHPGRQPSGAASRGRTWEFRVTRESPGLSPSLGGGPGGERTLLIFSRQCPLGLSPHSWPSQQGQAPQQPSGRWGCLTFGWSCHPSRPGGAQSRTGADPSPHLRAVNGAL